MYSKIIGNPISVLRYKVDTNFLKIIAFDYRNSNKEYKIKSSYDESRKDLNVVIESEDKNIPVINQVNHSLDYYIDIIRNNSKRPVPMKVVKNNSEDIKPIEFKFNDEVTIELPLQPHYQALIFDNKVVTYNENRSKESEYHICKNGIYELNDKFTDFRIISEDGHSAGSVEGINLFNPVIRVSKDIPSLNNIPKSIIVEADDCLETVDLDYDIYGILKSAISRMDCISCNYTTYELENSVQVKESVHNLFFDNFNYNNYFENGKKYVDEIIKLGIQGNYIEFIHVVYDNVDKVEEVEYKDPSEVDFDAIADKYFNY